MDPSVFSYQLYITGFFVICKPLFQGFTESLSLESKKMRIQFFQTISCFPVPIYSERPPGNTGGLSFDISIVFFNRRFCPPFTVPPGNSWSRRTWAENTPGTGGCW